MTSNGDYRDCRWYQCRACGNLYLYDYSPAARYRCQRCQLAPDLVFVKHYDGGHPLSIMRDDDEPETN